MTRNCFRFYEVKRIFLACPGDLMPERSRFPQVINTVNNLRAHLLGFHLEAAGWERVIPSFGRPQELINSELETSDLVIVMFWNRIGSPSKQGSERTATIEEYERALELFGERGAPLVWVYFKTPTAEPNDQLNGVLKFRRELESGKQLFFRDFADLDAWEEMVREHLVAYLDGLRRWAIDRNFESMDPRRRLMRGSFLGEGVYTFGSHLRLSIDLDGDGKDELISFWFSQFSYKLTVQKHDRVVFLALPEEFGQGQGGHVHLAIKDVTNDGLPEILAAHGNGSYHLSILVFGFRPGKRDVSAEQFGKIGDLTGQSHATVLEGGTIMLPYGSAGLAFVATWTGTEFSVRDEVVEIS